MEEKSFPEQIDDIIKLYGGWKAEILSKVRAAVHAGDPDVTETVKWKMKMRPEGLPVWEHDGIMCRMETYKNDMKLIFNKGAHIDDPKGIFNARLKSKDDRAIQFVEGSSVDEAGIANLVAQAANLNTSK